MCCAINRCFYLGSFLSLPLSKPSLQSAYETKHSNCCENCGVNGSPSPQVMETNFLINELRCFVYCLTPFPFLLYLAFCNIVARWRGKNSFCFFGISAFLILRYFKLEWVCRVYSFSFLINKNYVWKVNTDFYAALLILISEKASFALLQQ